MLSITLKSGILQDAKSHAVSRYPEECCGFMYGSFQDESLLIDLMQAIDNQRTENRTRRYLITPMQYREAEEFAERSNTQLLGVYHSHPNHPAVPSQYDLERALPGFVYLIVSVQQGRVADARWWELSLDRSKFLELNSVQVVK